MADIQKYFERFHDTIRTDFDMNATLREKRDILLEKIAKHLDENGRPAFKRLLQGSYTMKTGVKPIKGLDFDIDVGLYFEIDADDPKAESPKTVRGWVLEAVEGHTKSVESKSPCIRVNYADGYHVDLVVYARWVDVLANQQVRLAHKSQGWRHADPERILQYLHEATDRFDGTEDPATKIDQLRRVIRYLKRWDDEAMPTESDSKPSGLAFTVLAASNLSPTKDWAGNPVDVEALRAVASVGATAAGRLVITKPAPEYEDLFGKLTETSMDKLKERFASLGAKAKAAIDDPDPVTACKTLREVLGDDFPVPDPSDTGKKSSGPAIITTSSAASVLRR